MVSMALWDKTVLGFSWMTSSMRLSIEHLGQFVSPGTMKLIRMTLWYCKLEYLQCFFIQNFTHINYRSSFPMKNMVINVILTGGKCVAVPMVPQCYKASLVVSYALNQSIKIAVLASIYDPTHHENIRTTNTLRWEVA